MSKVTPLASNQITATDTITVELMETDTNPSVVVFRWPDKPTVLHPRRFPDAAATIARPFAEAHTVLASIKAGHRLMGSNGSALCTASLVLATQSTC